MAIIETSKAIADLIKKGATVELQEKIMQLRGEAVELQGEKINLKSENIELKKKLELQEKIEFKRKVYFREGDEVPYCPYCYEKHQLLIHLSLYEAGKGGEQLPCCQECETEYRVVNNEDFVLYGERRI